jgi:hypothetical protein
MKTHILYVGLALAVAVMGSPAQSRLLAQEPKDKKMIPGMDPAIFHLTVAEFTKDGVLMASHPVIVSVTYGTKVINVERPDGKAEPVTTAFAIPSIQLVTEKIDLKAIKSFVVTKDGKLEKLDTVKLPDMLKKPTPVLVGARDDGDPRLLELVRPGTIYLSIPPRLLDPPPETPPPLEKGLRR